MIDERKLFLAWAGDAIVGCAGWYDGSVRHVYVRPEMTRKQVGSRLLAAAEADFRLRSAARSIHANAAVYAAGFYEANGYRLLSMGLAWDGSSVCRMRKDF